MTNQPVQVGIFGHLAYNTGTYGVPVWTDIPIAHEVEIKADAGLVEANTRGNAPFKAFVRSLTDIEFSFKVVKDTSSTVYSMLQTAFLAGTAVDLVALNGPSTTGSGSEGFRAVCVLGEFSESQGDEGVIEVSVTAKPAYGLNGPTILGPL